ncbi:MAG: ATP-binding protein [Hydrogenophaga sp.]|uniref:sensor histidine kinase n=1 Tax=Hydrogenophaga sp. TaxID=1904254 RepID=UPI0025B8C2F4|nr:ATP-binding protein [Hydrogenophaga sp.]MDO9135323.1 ATP-binding protein [Hydrogenophaga sp.]MDO9506334.1 ATP-binding protein [Hydrogenophaga sp.]MDP2250676.1 ATP-binding protein [Hydrogenophaga sp.]MDP2988406.1 ATP-binding protein [Hydrogenophaga sp.]MDP3205293.1 ATP-binding protein [Hydrogenophaga sp.]
MNSPDTTSTLRKRPGAVRWAVGAGLVFMTGVGMVLLFLLTLATRNRALYEQNFGWLVAINVAVAGFLLLVIVWLGVRLAMRFKRGKFGSRLLIKLAAIIGLVGVLPGLLIYTVSYQFVSRSIESWFDVRVESALSAGLNLGRTTLDTLAADLSSKTRVAAEGLGRTPNSSAVLALERLREQLGVTDLILWSASGQALGSSGMSRFELTPERPSAAQLRSVRVSRVVAQIEGLDEGGDGELEAALAANQARIKVLALVSPPSFGFDAEPRFLQVVAPLPAALVADALAVQVANREYQERALAREGLRRMYIGTLTLALFLAVFGAVLLAVLLGNQLIRPLLVLAEGMREVATGDLSPKKSLTSRDELAGLTRTFALMTQDLSDARAAVQQSMEQVDAARDNLQTILDNLTAGVVVLDQQGRLQSVNPGAARILRTQLNVHMGQPLATVPGLETFSTAVLQQFERFLSDQTPHEGGYWQQSFELTANGTTPFDEGITLIARGALLPNNERLLVFDDVSEMVSAQRAKAWGEVARRLAHEIKNPLTPIQLSAERLAMKLDGKVQPAEQAILNKSVRTIVDQVDAMKRLVNEFRDYARLPAAQLQPVDLNALARDILSLYDNAAVPVHLEAADDLPLAQADPQQVRQILHNLVQNAQDAMAGVPDAQVLLRTRRSDSGQWVRLSVLDQGPGFAEHILKRAFEPYVTTKVKGTGLGLAVVKKIMDEHGGRVDLGNRVTDGKVIGAQVSLSFAVAN